MAHNVTERDGVFTVRGAAWWDLDGAHDLAEYPTREQAQRIAHPWEPVPEPVYRKRTVPRRFGPPTERFDRIEGQHLNVRSDDGYPLAVVPDTLETVTNGELYDIAEAIEGDDKGAVMFETGGSLDGGRKVWLLLRLRDPIWVAGDPNGATVPYFALQNYHDARGSFRGQATICRICCDNTSKMADLDAESRGTEFMFKHTRNVHDRIEQAKQALAGWRSSITAYQELSTHLIDLPITGDQRELFLEKFIPMPLPHTVSDRVVGNVEVARKMVRDILASPTCEGIDSTAYGLVQASVEYLNHARRAKSRESRFKRAYLDRNSIVTDAVDLAQKVAVS